MTNTDRFTSDPSLTAEERANIELIVKFRGLPFAERQKYTIPDFTPSRFGMANLAELFTGGKKGYDGNSIPDRVDEMVDIIAKSDRVWATWRIQGTHGGEMYGVPATGRPIDVLEIGQWRITNGLISEAWFFVDELDLVRQLGLWPVTTTAAPNDSLEN
jgi:hypothetical protein